MNRNTVIETLNSLPDEFNTEELIQKRLFIEKIKKGQQDVREGKTIPLQEAKQRLEAKWNQDR